MGGPSAGRGGDGGGASYDSDWVRLKLIGRSATFRVATDLIRRFAAHDVTVLLRGETGTGKELAARAIHYLGKRREQPFIPVNCGAIPDMLVESELFGQARGAFTDAREAQPGLVAQASGGTLFLDEVDSLSLKAQISLLRFLQDGSFRPLGARAYLHSDARVVAATNADLEHLVSHGLFRSDLFFRLAIVPLQLPPLREREGDVRLLAESLLRTFGEQHGSGPTRIDDATMRRLERHRWPGNVREMANVMQRAFLMSDGYVLVLPPGALGPDDPAAATADLADLASHRSAPCCTSYHAAREEALCEFERRFVCRALAASEGNVSLAARLAGKERRSFGRLLSNPRAGQPGPPPGGSSKVAQPHLLELACARVESHPGFHRSPGLGNRE